MTWVCYRPQDSIEFLPIGTFVARERETARMEEGDNNQHKDLIQSVAEVTSLLNAIPQPLVFRLVLRPSLIIVNLSRRAWECSEVDHADSYFRQGFRGSTMGLARPCGVGS